MAVKSLEELRKLRKDYQSTLSLRKQGEHEGDQIELRVGLGTCGISAGAKDTFQALLQEIDQRKLKNVKVVGVGCMGQCTSEPIVEVRKPDHEPLLYGPITSNIVHDFIEDTVVNEDYYKDGTLLIKTYEKVEV
ncbi:MAG: (2Fe-2S) ferredoxin domain-containing protein [Candidatus Izemoplasmataceae bacterium]